MITQIFSKEKLVVFALKMFTSITLPYFAQNVFWSVLFHQLARGWSLTWPHHTRTIINKLLGT